MSIIISTSRLLTNADISLTIDGQSIPFYSDNDNIIIDSKFDFGLHRLIITSHIKERFRIENVKIGNCNLRTLFYLAWSIDAQGRRLQPCNELWEINQEWVLPFGYPISYWISTVEKKFPNGEIGKNLYKNYWIWYPTSVNLDPKLPQIIRDFFKHDFDFTVVDKKNFSYSEIPFMKYNKKIETDLLLKAYHEVVSNLDLIKSLSSPYSQQRLNNQEFGLSKKQEWKVLLLHNQDNPNLYQNEFPACWKLIDKIFPKPWNAFIGMLPPGAIVYPHIDDASNANPKFSRYRGCTQIYIPLHWPAGNYIKMANAGIPDMESGAMIINNDSFVHALVNCSNDYRYVLAIRVDHDFISNLDITC